MAVFNHIGKEVNGNCIQEEVKKHIKIGKYLAQCKISSYRPFCCLQARVKASLSTP
jgi:hypothetical protein